MVSQNKADSLNQLLLMEGGQQFFVSVEDDAFNSLTSITAYVASDKDRAYDRNQAVEGPNDENFASNRAI